MQRMAIIMGAVALMLPAGAMAQTVLRMGDVGVLHQPEPASYQPEGNYDLADAGKTFDIACIVGGDGRLSGCKAMANNIVDQNFVTVALDNASGWVIQPRDHFGKSTAGRTFLLICQFKRSDDVEATPSLASADGAK